jgi:hypothetical protein
MRAARIGLVWRGKLSEMSDDRNLELAAMYRRLAARCGTPAFVNRFTDLASEYEAAALRQCSTHASSGLFHFWERDVAPEVVEESPRPPPLA